MCVGEFVNKTLKGSFICQSVSQPCRSFRKLSGPVLEELYREPKQSMTCYKYVTGDNYVAYCRQSNRDILLWSIILNGAGFDIISGVIILLAFKFWENKSRAGFREQIGGLNGLNKSWKKPQETNKQVHPRGDLLCPFKGTMFLTLKKLDQFGCFNWKFKLKKVLENGVLFSEFTCCSSFNENASWPFLSICNDKVDFRKTFDWNWEHFARKEYFRFYFRLNPNFWRDYSWLKASVQISTEMKSWLPMNKLKWVIFPFWF